MTIKSKLYICALLAISIIAINCKKSTESETTLADRAGTYKIVSDKATYQFIIHKNGYITDNHPASTNAYYLAEPTSTATVFYYQDSLIINFSEMTIIIKYLSELNNEPQPFIKVS